jgi:hypothetical protein
MARDYAGGEIPVKDMGRGDGGEVTGGRLMVEKLITSTPLVQEQETQVDAISKAPLSKKPEPP